VTRVDPRRIPALVLLAVVLLSPSYISAEHEKDSLYTYHVTGYSTGDYAGLVADMQNLNATYPGIFELFTAQDAFGVPDVVYGSETYKTWIIRITNESSGFDKPEVLFIGGHHGDEKVGVEAAYYLAEWLAEHYATDDWIRYLVDHREIYIVPVANPYGWVHHQRYDENGIDMNRDYPYDSSSHIFATVGARAIHELTKRHLFINTVSWHGGTEMIIYAWGCYAHTSNTESPDDIAFYNQGQYMSAYGGPYSGYYPWGRANDILYPCYGAYEDYAYAASWDLANAEPLWPTNGCRSLTHCIEISSSKFPSESTLGGRNGVYNPGGTEDGYVPKNIRIALMLTDIAEPYIEITDSPPQEAEPGATVNISWKVMGALTTAETAVQYGLDADPINNYTYVTSLQSGGTGWQDVEYHESITLPAQPGTYYFTIRAKVDQDTLNQNNPEPQVAPQSLYVNMRTNDSWSISNYNNTLEGHENWYSRIFTINVFPPEIELYSGWNLITIPVQNNYTASDLAALIPECDMIAWWNAASGTYSTFIVGVTPPGSPWDFNISGGVGYYLSVTDTTTFTLNGTPLTDVSVALYPGWNAIGWWNTTSTTAAMLASQIIDCQMIAQWDAETGTYITFLAGITPPGSPWDFTILRGMGLLVKVSSGSVWEG